MTYRVKIREQNDIKNDEEVDTRSYPSPGTAGENDVKSNLILLYRDEKWSSKLKGSKKYRVVLTQERGNKSLIFDLVTSNEYSTTKMAYNMLNSTLSLMLASGAVLFTKELLMEIVLPRPLSSEDIGPHLVDVMEKSPDTHPEWVDVIQSLLADVQLPPKPHTQTKLECFQKYFRDNAPKSRLVHESLTSVSVELLTANATFAAVPQAAKAYTDDDTSERVWKNFRRGTLTKFNSQGDDKSKTWLIEAVEKQYLKSSVKLTLSGVGTSDHHSITGDTALHIAVRLANITLVKLLLAYKADPTVPNAADETPISIADKLTCKNAKDICNALEEINKYQARTKTYYLQNTELPEPKNSSDVFLLSLDGGGMRSVVMCHMLTAIENRMKELSNSCKPLRSYFDYIAGTSAGAIIGSLLLYADVPIPLAGMYLYKFMVDVFGSPKSERGVKLRDYLVDLVKEETTLSDLKEGNMIVTTTIANVSPNKLHLMTSYGEARDNQLGPDNRKVWEALVASSAAPTYFPAFQSFLDGGLMSNNPTLPAMNDIIRQAKKQSTKAKIGCILSMGTGYVASVPVDNFEVFVPGFTIDVAKNLFQSSMGLVSLLTHFAEQTTQSNGEVVLQAESWCDSIDASYFRFSPPLEYSLPPDTDSIEDVVTLLFDTEVYILQQFSQIDKIAKTILTK